jgi:hypothetical protein
MSLNHLITGNPYPLNVEFNDVTIDGLLTVDGNPLAKIDSGQYTSGLTGDAATLNGLNEPAPPIYTRIGDVVTIHGGMRCNPLQDQVRFLINLPPGTSNNNTNLNFIINGTKGGVIAYIQTDAVVTGGTQLEFFVDTVNGATLVPASATNTIFQYFITFVSTI